MQACDLTEPRTLSLCEQVLPGQEQLQLESALFPAPLANAMQTLPGTPPAEVHIARPGLSERASRYRIGNAQNYIFKLPGVPTQTQLTAGSNPETRLVSLLVQARVAAENDAAQVRVHVIKDAHVAIPVHVYTSTSMSYTLVQTRRNRHRHVPTHTQTQLHTHTHTHTHTYTHTCTHTHAQAFIHTHTHAQTLTHTHTRTHIHTYTHKHTHVCKHKCILSCTHAPMHIINGKWYNHVHTYRSSNASRYGHVARFTAAKAVCSQPQIGCNGSSS